MKKWRVWLALCTDYQGVTSDPAAGWPERGAHQAHRPARLTKQPHQFFRHIPTQQHGFGCIVCLSVTSIYIKHCGDEVCQCWTTVLLWEFARANIVLPTHIGPLFMTDCWEINENWSSYKFIFCNNFSSDSMYSLIDFIMLHSFLCENLLGAAWTKIINLHTPAYIKAWPCLNFRLTATTKSRQTKNILNIKSRDKITMAGSLKIQKYLQEVCKLSVYVWCRKT